MHVCGTIIGLGHVPHVKFQEAVAFLRQNYQMFVNDIKAEMLDIERHNLLSINVRYSDFEAVSIRFESLLL